MRVRAEDERARFEELDREECLRLLGWETVGRLVTYEATHPAEITPVNFALDGEAVVFRCEASRAERLVGKLASFEVDRFDYVHGFGWSVVVAGLLTAGAPGDAGAGVWAPGERGSVLRLEPQNVSGRRIAPVPNHFSGVGYL